MMVRLVGEEFGEGFLGFEHGTSVFKRVQHACISGLEGPKGGL